jgi:membrane associated rhomboid family serine protease
LGEEPLLIPLRHENMRGRRWPYATFALIALNIVIFLVTHGPIEREQPQIAEVRIHLILLSAMHPDLEMPPEVFHFVESVKKKSGIGWEKLASPQRRTFDAWDSQIRRVDDPQVLQHEMDTLSAEFENQEQSTILGKYGFIPARPRVLPYLSANFLHGGWMHLIGNMWFLWLAGFILEDTWGRAIYAAFYLLVGALALQFYAWCTPGSFVPLIGASGAVAALMGAFLVRFPKLRIEMATFVAFYPIKFKMPAYWLLPLWLAAEFLYGSAFGQSSRVAHWAHVGGFLFGMLGAFVVQRSGLEQQANEAIEAQLGWKSDPDIERASEAMGQSRFEEAAAILQQHLAAKPATLDALNLLQLVHWRRQDTPAYLQATVQLCQFHLKAQDFDAALKAFEEYTAGGGDCMPPAAWLELTRKLEAREHFERAVTEYERLATAYPTQKESLLALLSAGRLCLRKLNRPADALRNYKAAQASTVPHLDWETNICAGIRDAEKACSPATAGLVK